MKISNLVIFNSAPSHLAQLSNKAAFYGKMQSTDLLSIWNPLFELSDIYYISNRSHYLE